MAKRILTPEYVTKNTHVEYQGRHHTLSPAEESLRRRYLGYLVAMQFPSRPMFDEMFHPNFARVAADPLTTSRSPHIPARSGLDELRAQQQALHDAYDFRSLEAEVEQDDDMFRAYVVTDYDNRYREGRILIAQREIVVFTAGLVRTRIEMGSAEVLPLPETPPETT